MTNSAVRLCTIPKCGREHQARGLCRAHYYRWFKYGDTRPDVPVRVVDQSRRALDRWKCLRCVDIAWLIDAGESLDSIAERLTNSGDTVARKRELIRRHLRRHHRYDLLQRFQTSC